MLKGIDPLLNADLLFTLAAMGHGDEIVLVDANFPATATARRLVRYDAADAVATLRAVLTLLPLDEFVPDPVQVMEVVGETASLVITQPFKPGAGAQLLLNRGDKSETIDVPEADLYLGEVEDLADAVLLGKPPRVSLGDSRGNVAATVALLRSARENRPIRLG